MSEYTDPATPAPPSSPRDQGTARVTPVQVTQPVRAVPLRRVSQAELREAAKQEKNALDRKVKKQVRKKTAKKAEEQRRSEAVEAAMKAEENRVAAAKKAAAARRAAAAKQAAEQKAAQQRAAQKPAPRKAAARMPAPAQASGKTGPQALSTDPGAQQALREAKATATALSTVLPTPRKAVAKRPSRPAAKPQAKAGNAVLPMPAELRQQVDQAQAEVAAEKKNEAKGKAKPPRKVAAAKQAAAKPRQSAAKAGTTRAKKFSQRVKYARKHPFTASLAVLLVATTLTWRAAKGTGRLLKSGVTKAWKRGEDDRLNRRAAKKAADATAAGHKGCSACKGTGVLPKHNPDGTWAGSVRCTAGAARRVLARRSA
jgi:hypothetical protein